MITVVR